MWPISMDWADLDISEFRKLDIPAGNPDAVGLVHGPVGLVVVMLAFKLRMGCTFGKEVF